MQESCRQCAGYGNQCGVPVVSYDPALYACHQRGDSKAAQGEGLEGWEVCLTSCKDGQREKQYSLIFSNSEVFRIHIQSRCHMQTAEHALILQSAGYYLLNNVPNTATRIGELKSVDYFRSTIEREVYFCIGRSHIFNQYTSACTKI